MLRPILRKSLVTALTCLLAGIVVYGFDVFDIHRPTFQFVSTGIAGSLFIFTLGEAGIRPALIVLLLFFIIMTGFLTQGYRHGLLLRDAVYVAAVGITLFLYSTRIHRKGHRRQWLLPVILGALMGAVMMLGILLLAPVLSLIRDEQLTLFYPRIWPIVVMNFVVGLGLGTGIVVSEYLTPVSMHDDSGHTGRRT